MRAFAWLRARPRAVASTGAVTAGVLALTTLAFVYQGRPTTEVDLHDGGVWVTKQSSLMVGHFNHESQVLDGGLRTTTDDYDVLQSGATVVVADNADSTITVVDPAMVALSESADVPSGAKVVLGGPALAILEQATGSLWVLPAAALGSFTAAATDPTYELGKAADVTVSPDGTVFAVSPDDGTIVTIGTDAEGAPTDPATKALGEIPSGAKTTITAVGQTAIVLAGDTVISSDGLRTDAAAVGDGVLQQPSGAASGVAIATPDRLITVPFDGSEAVIAEAGARGHSSGAGDARRLHLRGVVGIGEVRARLRGIG